MSHCTYCNNTMKLVTSACHFLSQHMMEMYGKLHGAYRKVVDIMATGRRYLATYFRIAFYGRVRGCLCIQGKKDKSKITLSELHYR